MNLNYEISRPQWTTALQVSAMLGPLKNKLNQLMQGAGAAAQRKPGDIFHRGACRVSRQEAVHKLHQLQQSIGDWEGKELVSESTNSGCDKPLVDIKIKVLF